jgi:hypothetical protein
MGKINPDLTGSLHGDDLKPAIETILREMDGKLSTDNIEEINASTVNVYNLNADNITTGTIDASKIDVTNLDADNITTGTINAIDITGSTITGATLQTASSGTRVTISPDGNVRYYVGSTLRMLQGTSSITFYDSTGARVGHIVGDNVSYTNPTVAFDSDIYVGQKLLVFDDGAGDQPLLYCDPATGGLRSESIDFYCDGDIDCGGTKYFNIPHPTKEGMRLKYSCPESPENLVICRGKKGEKPPQHFYDVSEPNTEEYVTGTEGNWICTAIRKGYKNFNPEIIDNRTQTKKNNRIK